MSMEEETEAGAETDVEPSESPELQAEAPAAPEEPLPKKAVQPPSPMQIAAELRRKRKRQERAAIIFTLTFAVLIILGAWLTDGRLFTSPWNAIMALEAPGQASRSAALNCRNPKNKRTPYCLNRRAEIKASWDGIVRTKSGEQPFSLHGK